MNHTSDQHPWFEAARRDPASRFRSYYVWADHPAPVPPGAGTIFPGEEDSVWTYDAVAGTYYHHRFYHFQPDLNFTCPDVLDEVERVLDFWLAFGVSGFRIDAASHMVEGPGSLQPEDPHGILRRFRQFVDERGSEVVLLGEADVEPERLADFFGDGDELTMLFNFVLNNYLFLAFAREDGEPLIRILRQLPALPPSAQWVPFLRNLDEVDLERLSEDERQEVFEPLAPDADMRIFGRGIRRRLAPMLGGDRRRIELAFSLLFTLPGAPMLVYGDEIGMGEDLGVDGRGAVRLPMQWDGSRNGGFSGARKGDLIQPPLADGPFGYKSVNVEAQREDPDSLLHAVRRFVFARRAAPEFGVGSWHLFDTGTSAVVAHRCTGPDGIVAAVHNFSGEEQTVALELTGQRGRRLYDLFADGDGEAIQDDTLEVTLPPYGYRWFRIGGERAAP